MKTSNFLRLFTLFFLMAFFSLTSVGLAADPPFLIYLPLVSRPEISIPLSSVLAPFNADVSDLLGPSDWYANYGKTPEIIAVPSGLSLDILAQDYDSATPWKAVLLHIEPSSSGVGYKVTQALTDLPFLDRVMGLAVDASGNRYYATGVDESSVVNSSYPPLNTFRSNIVRVVKLNPEGQVQFNIDLDTARHAFNSGAEMIINPMTFGSARLAVGANEIALVHSINTAPDGNLGGARHQKALSTRLNATTGAITQIANIWVSHSFDQRLLFDGTGIVENHLGDAYPRAVVFGRDLHEYSLFDIKGPTGENLTATRLGNIALIQNDPVYAYLALFASENTSTPGTMSGGGMIKGPRNLAIVRINRSDNTIDPGLPDTLAVTSSGAQKINHLKWLTQYSAGSNLHAERPKLVGIGGNHYIVLWEEWLNSGSYSNTFNGTYAMLIDAGGNILHAPLLLTSHHLPRGDDAFLLNGRAAWVTGSTAEKKLYIHFVDGSLTYEMLTLD